MPDAICYCFALCAARDVNDFLLQLHSLMFLLNSVRTASCAGGRLRKLPRSKGRNRAGRPQPARSIPLSALLAALQHGNVPRHGRWVLDCDSSAGIPESNAERAPVSIPAALPFTRLWSCGVCCPFGRTGEFPPLTFGGRALVGGDARPGLGALACSFPGLLSWLARKRETSSLRLQECATRA